jgi:tetratricopeptide (TPR) repeat protein
MLLPSNYCVSILTYYSDSANTLCSLAYAHPKAGNIEKAIEHFRNALKCDPKFTAALQGLV